MPSPDPSRPLSQTEIVMVRITQKPFIHLLLVCLLIAPLGALLVGCSSTEEEGERPASLQDLRRSVAAPVDRTEEQKAQAREAGRGMWMWPADKGPARDLDADGEACAQQIREDPAKRSQSGIGIMVLLARCLEEKGWERDPNWHAQAR